MDHISVAPSKKHSCSGTLTKTESGLKMLLIAMTVLLVCGNASWAATIAGNVADYNAAQVKLANGTITVPKAVVTYTASTTIAIGSSFTVTLPAGFTFGSAPALTTSGTATFSLASGGLGAQFATFTVATANVTSGQTISIASFTANGATTLETVTPVASALPVTMQAIGTDAMPLSFGAFASDVGAVAVFVGAIQFIDISPPSNGTEFYGPPDTPTVVLSAIAISAQTVDSATKLVPILSPDGTPNSLSKTDTATVTIPGSFAGFGTVFTDSASDCKNPATTGSVGVSGLTFPNVPINVEVFFCVTASGGPIQTEPNGFPTVVVTPGSSQDFLSAPVNNEFPGLICVTDGNQSNYSCPFTQPFVSAVVPESDGVYQLRYFANLDKGDSYVNLSNAGSLNGFDPAGRICVNAYTFDPAEELISCCACPVTPNGLNSLSARNDLVSNTLTPGVPTSITVKLVATAGAACNPSTPTSANLVRGMRAWATTLHLNTSGSPAVGYQATETPFSVVELSTSELTKLTSYCSFIQANGSGFGICKSCRAGALGATQH